ncbi:hypothetical protein Plhal304r1_c094g0172981 [Plasmopara halstedii]
MTKTQAHSQKCYTYDDVQPSLLQIAAVSPWSNITPATPVEVNFSKKQLQNAKALHHSAHPIATREISYDPSCLANGMLRHDPFRSPYSIISAVPKKPQHLAPSHPSKIAHRGSSRADRLDAKPVVHAYQKLLKEVESMKFEAAKNAEIRQMEDAAYLMGLANISDVMVAKQKDLLRYYTFKNEVDVFQQHLVPFIFGIRSKHERQVYSSVNRHYNRMKSIQDMGIHIHNLGDYRLEKTDRVISARTNNTLYRRIRRQSAAKVVDMENIRPARHTSKLGTQIDDKFIYQTHEKRNFE